MELPSQTLGRKVRPQSQSTRGLQENQVPNTFAPAASFASSIPGGGQLSDILMNFANAYQTNEDRQLGLLGGRVESDLARRGLGGSASGADIKAQQEANFMAQSGAGLTSATLGLVPSLWGMANQATQSELDRSQAMRVLGMQGDISRQNMYAQQVTNPIEARRQGIPLSVQEYESGVNAYRRLNPDWNKDPYAAIASLIQNQSGGGIGGGGGMPTGFSLENLPPTSSGNPNLVNNSLPGGWQGTPIEQLRKPWLKPTAPGGIPTPSATGTNTYTPNNPGVNLPQIPQSMQSSYYGF